jgi:hypothetical protein
MELEIGGNGPGYDVRVIQSAGGREPHATVTLDLHGLI